MGSIIVVSPASQKAHQLKQALASGVSSSVKEVQALALTTICKLVELAGAEQIRPQLSDLVPPMLESLSGMEVHFPAELTAL